MKYATKNAIKIVLGILLLIAILIGAGLFGCKSSMDLYDKIAIIIFLGSYSIGVTWTLLLYGAHTYKERTAYMPFLERKVAWYKLAGFLNLTYYWLICVNFFVPAFIMVIMINDSNIEVLRIVLYSLVSIFGTLLGFILRPDKQAYGYRVAFEALDRKLYEVEDIDEAIGKKELRETLEKCEKYITHAVYGTFDVDKEHTHECCINKRS